MRMTTSFSMSHVWPLSRLAQKSGDKQTVPALVETARDTNEDVQLVAAAALAALGDMRMHELLIKRLRTASEALRRNGRDEVHLNAMTTIVNALGDNIGPEAVEPLTSVLHARYYRAVSTAARALGRTGDKRAVKPLMAVIRNPGDGKFEQRETYPTVARALGDLGDPSAFDALMHLAHASHYRHAETREAALRAAARLDPERAIPALIKTLGETLAHDVSQIKVICAALSELSDPRAVPPVLDQLKSDLPEVRIAAVDALKALAAGVPAALDALIAEMKCESAARRNAAAVALAEVGRPAHDPVVAALADDDPHLRQGAAWTLGFMANTNSIPALARALNDRELHVRIAAAWALGECDGVTAAAALTPLLASENPRLRTAAAQALGKVGVPASVEDLAPLTRDEVVEVRVAAIRALGLIGGGSALPHIGAAANDSNPRIQAAAKEALAAMAEPRP